MDESNIRLGFALTGSFCTLRKAVDALSVLAEQGYSLFPIMSETVFSTDTRFGKCRDFRIEVEGICGRAIISTIPQAEPIGPKKLLDALVIAPCTGNTLAKLAQGVNDGCVPLAAKASLRNNCPIIVAPSTNESVIIGINGENLVKSRASAFVPFPFLLRDKPKSFKSQKIINERL